MTFPSHPRIANDAALPGLTEQTLPIAQTAIFVGWLVSALLLNRVRMPGAALGARQRGFRVKRWFGATHKRRALMLEGEKGRNGSEADWRT